MEFKVISYFYKNQIIYVVLGIGKVAIFEKEILRHGYKMT
jgi:hypothetical protein